jgi:hypothetical protein
MKWHENTSKRLQDKLFDVSVLVFTREMGSSVLPSFILPHSERWSEHSLQNSEYGRVATTAILRETQHITIYILFLMPSCGF